MDNCKNCANRVYDERWGQYKCSVYQHRIKDADKYIGCESHEPKNGKVRRKDER